MSTSNNLLAFNLFAQSDENDFYEKTKSILHQHNFKNIPVPEQPNPHAIYFIGTANDPKELIVIAKEMDRHIDLDELRINYMGFHNDYGRIELDGGKYGIDLHQSELTVLTEDGNKWEI